MLKNSRIRPYKTNKKGKTHLLDIYADDLMIYLESKRNSKAMNLRNVQEVLRIVEVFYKWSGLKFNGGKTYSTIFGESLRQPKYVEKLGIKWCTSFELLGGIQFDQILDWRFRHLTSFGKITVIKTLFLPKFTHITF